VRKKERTKQRTSCHMK